MNSERQWEKVYFPGGLVEIFVKLHRSQSHNDITLFAASLSFFVAIVGRKVYGNITELRLVRSLHSINLNCNDD